MPEKVIGYLQLSFGVLKVIMTVGGGGRGVTWLEEKWFVAYGMKWLSLQVR